MPKRITFILTLAVCAVACAQSVKLSSATLPFGNLSHADGKQSDNFLLVKDGYVCSVSDPRGQPNWCEWTLEKKDIGSVDRQNDFHADEDLPADFKHVKPSDYDATGYDRGHIVNSQARTRTAKLNQETFSMANMSPQLPELNRATWKAFENWAETEADGGHHLDIAAGCAGGTKTIGPTKRKITIPADCWKVVLEDGKYLIAVDMPNTHAVDKKVWQKYETTVQAIEKETGFKFTLPKNAKPLEVN
jgi:endonuclease G